MRFVRNVKCMWYEWIGVGVLINFITKTTILQSEEDAKKYDKNNSATVKIYTDESSIEGGIGAAATLYINNTHCRSLQFHLGSDKHHTVFEAKLVGLMLGAALLQQIDYLEDGTIAIDNQAAAKAITNFCSAPGQHLIDFFLKQMSGLANRHKGVSFEIYWIPAHQGIPGNEEADKLAKQAAKQQCDFTPSLPAILHAPLPHRKSARKTALTGQLKEKITPKCLPPTIES